MHDPTGSNMNSGHESDRSHPSGSVALRVPSVLGSAYDIRNQILDEARRMGYDDSVCFGVQLAIDEGLSNAIKHGNRSDPDRHIEIVYQVDDQRIYLWVADEGQGFDPNEVEDPTIEENLEAPTGRGIFLMRAYMTTIRYNERGNELTLIFDRQPTRARQKSG
jgi:serine/threonine-protein kinase RsbW